LNKIKNFIKLYDHSFLQKWASGSYDEESRQTHKNIDDPPFCSSWSVSGIKKWWAGKSFFFFNINVSKRNMSSIMKTKTKIKIN